jgi:exo-beta-1,3-glucanase (GH17 family)
MLRSLGLFALVACAIALVWYGMGQPVPMPPSPLASGDKLTCISYTPFHGDQAPFTWDLHIPDEQIASDLKSLSQTTACVRTYSARGAQGRVTRFAAGLGLKVLQGVWLGRNLADNRREIEAALTLARRYPGTVEALIVGNEVLLRGELPAARIKSYLEEVKRRSGLPVTYADVWEFWLRSPELVPATNFVTIHILPYWEDKPVAAEDAIKHVREVREKVATAFGGKEILIGEVGWPSEGRMRDGALPSPANQARVLTDVVAAAKQDGWKVNLIEAFDQPWKRLLEGTVGGYWGLYDDARREPKFRFGEPVSNEPHWRTAASLGIGVAFLVFLAYWLGRRDSASHAEGRRLELAVTLIALGSGLVFGWAALILPMDSVVAGDRFRSVLMFLLALVVPMAASFALARGQGLAGFGEVLDCSRWRKSDSVGLILAALFIATVIAAIHVALGLVFDPRYKDFPVASLTGPAVALFILALADASTPTPPKPGQAEIAAAAVLAGSALFVTANERGANWQAVWFALLLVLLALTALRARAAPG